MNRRQFALVSVPAAVLTGCRSGAKPSREATLFHNKAVNAAVINLQEAVNIMDERMSAFGPENWRDALASLQTATIRLRSDMEQLRSALGYVDAGDTDQAEHS